ncbi:MAG: hypothetical protein ABSA13_18460 [Beijerinckiaceae bacterium]
MREADDFHGHKGNEALFQVIIKGKNGRRHEVDFGEAPIQVKIHASDKTIEISIDADHESLPESRRCFAIMNIPRHLFSEASGLAARRKVKEA